MPKQKSNNCDYSEFIICNVANCRDCGWNPKEQKRRADIPLTPNKHGMMRKQLCRNKKGY